MDLNCLNGKESLGIEFGSTRIKAVLIDESCQPIASGSYTWENRLENGIWTYRTEDIWLGLQAAYSDLNREVFEKTGSYISTLASIGISAMMHGYLPFDKDGNLLTQFRTWRNTITENAARELTSAFHFNIPQRWSIAHLYQAILNREKHVESIDSLTTLAGYVHRMLSGERVIGIGDASGMFPIDSNIMNYDEKMLSLFDDLCRKKGCGLNIRSILPKVLSAGENAGSLTEKGAKLLDASGNLKAGALMCPPEGDAGTGMVATNSVTVRTGNVSAGTSIFSMVVLEKKLSKVYEEIDMVTTPAGMPVAMVHCNNCCTDLDYWVKLFEQFSKICGANVPKSEIYDLLYNCAVDESADANCGGLLNFNYFSGEPVSHTAHGRPLFVRTQDSHFNLSNFMRSQIYSTMATLKIGMEILEKEKVCIDSLTGHGGLFKTPKVGQKLMAGAMNCPVSVMETAGEGGAWGIAVLARYVLHSQDMSLDEYLKNCVFSQYKSITVSPDEQDVKGFSDYMKQYKNALALEKCAADYL